VKKIWGLFIIIVLMSSSVYGKDYVIGDGDTLSISVWGNKELSIETTVRPDGKISIPALSDVTASGLTTMELTRNIEKALKKIVKTPIVTVLITNMTNYRIFVFGKGAPTGVHTLVRESTLLEFLSQLGALENADLHNSYLVRNKKTIKKDFYELFEKGDFSHDITLEPNDMIFIPDNYNKRITVVGAVSTPTTLPYREELTVLDVILSSGGFTEFAKKNDLEIYRSKEFARSENISFNKSMNTKLALNNSNYKERVKISVRAKDLMKGDLSKNLRIMPGDVIVVKETLF
jgi:polysaccharide export outer membrane protein